MEALCPSAATATTTTTTYKFPINSRKASIQFSVPIGFPISQKNPSVITVSSLISPISPLTKASATSASTSTSNSSPFTSSGVSERNHWKVLMDKPPEGVVSKPEIINYYARTLEKVLGSEKDAQMCIYNASCDTHFGFCCSVDEAASHELARLPGVLSVREDPDYNSNKKDYSFVSTESRKVSDPYIYKGGLPLFPSGNTKHWLVLMDKPGVGVVTKAQMVDYYAQILTKVLGNEKDAQMCIYHVSWQSNFGFCCELDDECAKELAGVPGVLSVEPDRNFASKNKDYTGNKLQGSTNQPVSSKAIDMTPIRTKKLFVTGLSFYTSEKTLRAAFEGFGELVEVKIIMDKISKRSKGYAFVEYTTEEAASAALEEMNGKIINGWMITVDVAKSKSYKFRSDQPRTSV
ncbi:hypothetical protein SLEP1_g47491 [Rubroshorea leprosula]|uniref:RRM domain-containing protein n=1 Tax=Rubroshorea leprosula TaxID=152421 RepID=A0AAV5LQN6_9ROSI|nr:hypothetical protein SLEP1_g47491 [Rubroshorea leprosula]